MSAPNLRCSVEWCLQPASPGMVLFDMPMETDIREKWVELLGTLPSTARKFFVCSGHFPDEEFISGSLFRKLKSNATPSRNFFVRPLDINTNSSAPVKVEPGEELTAENSICRACMSECNEHYKSLLKPEILSLFESSTGVLLTKSRRLPNVICDECFETMSNWQGFKKMCIKSNDVFTKRLEEESSTSGFIDISTSSSNRKRSTSIVADNSSNKRQKINRQAPTSEDISYESDQDNDDRDIDVGDDSSIASSDTGNDPCYASQPTVSPKSFVFRDPTDIQTLIKLKTPMVIYEYKQTKKLTNGHRSILINAIVEECVKNMTSKPPPFFEAIVDELVKMFPSERNCRELYVIPPRGGKLCNKYYNRRVKILKTAKKLIPLRDIESSPVRENDVSDYDVVTADSFIAGSDTGNDSCNTSEANASPKLFVFRDPSDTHTLFKLKAPMVIYEYKQTNQLTNGQRSTLINVLVDECVKNIASKPPSFFEAIVDEIVKMFPSERTCRELYVIPPRGGKLCNKYYNQRVKILKTVKKLIPIRDAEGSPTREDGIRDFDVVASRKLKKILSEDIDNWSEVEKHWIQTARLRQSEIQNISPVTANFLNEWPKLRDERAPSLIKIDFDSLYPYKAQGLHVKWGVFKKSVMKYYMITINDKKSDYIFKQTYTEKDSIDYVNAILINAVLCPTSRFKNEEGKKQRKATIEDAQTSFIAYDTSLTNAKYKLKEMQAKFFDEDFTIQPSMITVGSSIFSLREFYVIMDGCVYKQDSILDCIDLCFKIHRTLNLPYPKITRWIWVFIQKYFFGITTPSDTQSSSVVALIDYLNRNC